VRAVVFRKSQGLVVEEVATPAPGEDGVLVQVVNTGFCGSDHSLIASGGLPDGAILGHETAGMVVDVGRRVKDVTPGARVIIRPTSCGRCVDCRAGRPYFCQVDRRSIGIGDLPGAFAEYVRVDPRMLIPIPGGVDSRNAALAECFAASLHAVNVAGECEGSALVIGGGPIGLAMTRLLKLKGFGPILVSEPVAEKRAIALEFGADRVFDPSTEDLGQGVFACTGGEGVGVTFECSGVPELVQTALDTTTRGGTVCIVSIMYDRVSFLPLTLSFKEIRLTASYSNTHDENARCLAWMAEGKLDGRRMITDLISLGHLPRAFTDRIDTGKAVKVMLRIGEEF
jgi:(R,R)-butanediol dehydrogenase/meso-butanediol dehydrogenase/diacetyl reductase